MKTIGIGLIGAGNIAQFHMQGYNSIREAYGEYIPHFVVVADQNIKAAESIRDRYGYETATTDWHDVIGNPAVDVVLITSPNFLHAEMVIAAANAGKHVMCEKPMAMNKEEGKAMCEAIDKADVTSLIDCIYLKCPTVVETRRMIEAGELGDIITFRGWFNSGYKADPNSPMEWRQYKKLAGTGALGDITAHVISLSDYLVNGQLGGIEEVCTAWDIVIPERSDGKNPASRVPVDTDDLNYMISQVCIHEIDLIKWLVDDEYESVWVELPRQSRHAESTLHDPQKAHIRTKKGVCIDVELNVNCQFAYDIQCQVVGEDGAIALPDPSYYQVRKAGMRGMPMCTNWEERFADAYTVEMQDWVNNTLSDCTGGPNSWDGYVAAVTADALNASRREYHRMTVDLPERPAFYR